MLLLDLLVFLNGLYIPYMPLSPPIQAATAATWTLRGGAITPLVLALAPKRHILQFIRVIL